MYMKSAKIVFAIKLFRVNGIFGPQTISYISNWFQNKKMYQISPKMKNVSP